MRRHEVWIACHGPLSCNSGGHVRPLAVGLARRGYSVTVCVPERADDEGDLGDVRVTTFAAAIAGAGPPPDLVHLWTPRERMRRFLAAVCHRHGPVPHLVHLEDDEGLLVRRQLGLTAADFDQVAGGRRPLEVPDHLAHPGHARQLVAEAAGVTALIEPLLGSVPAGVPKACFRPGFDPAFATPRPEAGRFVRRRLGIDGGCAVVAYTGNVHAANVDEVRSLYLAVALANRAGLPITLVRTGVDFVPLCEHGHAELHRHAIELGHVPRADLPDLVHAADVLVQPGRVDEWNARRVPSKLPEWLVSGRPVILPRVNLGLDLVHGENAIVLPEAMAEPIVAALREWLPRPERLAAIGAAGREFALRKLTWEAATDAVADLYGRVLASRGGSPPHPTRASGRGAALDHYARRPVTTGLSVATVGDFSDSLEHLRDLATAAGDLKDVQRPWMLKTLLGLVPPGSRVCEIGAGEPLVAGALATLGYRVTIVDPYDGSGNGPTCVERFRDAWPGLRIVQSRFGSEVPGLVPGEFDAVYSISVLEHLDESGLAAVAAGIRRLLRPGGRSVHAIDHVAAGAGSDHHRRMLGLFLAGEGVEARVIDGVLAAAMTDTETYFLSAESHNRWRGTVPYDRYPMRKVISVQWVS